MMAATKGTQTSRDWAIPTYVDTEALLDLLAAIGDGFSLVEKVTARNTESSASEKSIQGEAGLSDWLSNVLKFNLTGSHSQKKSDESGEERQSDRYHTYGSLLHRVRTSLVEAKILHTEKWETVVSSDFVEMRGLFRSNSFSDWINVMCRSIEMAERWQTFQDKSSIFQQTPEIQASRAAITKNKKSPHPHSAHMSNPVLDFLKGLRSDVEPVERAGVRTFVVDLSNSDSPDDRKYRAVVSLSPEFIKSKYHLTDGEFIILGKVARHITEGSINLLSGTALSVVGNDILDKLVKDLNSATSTLNAPEIKPEIPAPAIELMPIAIYL